MRLKLLILFLLFAGTTHAQGFMLFGDTLWYADGVHAPMQLNKNAYNKADADARFLQITAAAATYQPIGSYLTTSTAASTYQTQAAMSSYLTSATAASTYEAKITASNTAGRYWTGYKTFAQLNTDSITEGTTNKFRLPTTFNATPNRSLSTTGSNNTFTISTTKNARVQYTINFSIALLAAASNGVVSLDYSTDGGTNWITAGSVSQQYSVAVTLTTNNDQVLSGEIPANALVRIYRSANTNCTVTAPTTKQQEITN